MDVLARIKADGLEELYWAHPSTHQQIRRNDMLGLILGLLINTTCVACSSGSRIPIEVVTVFLQFLQLMWLLTHKTSYSKWRMTVTWLQRLRWGISIFLRASGFFGTSIFHQFHVPKARSGELRAVWAVAVSYPITGMFVSINHPLPFKQQVFVAAFVLAAYIRYGLPAQIADVQSVSSGKHLQTTCMFIASIFSIFVDQGHTAACMGEHNASMVLIIAHIMIGAMVPLQLTYLQERQSKLAFLESRGLVNVVDRCELGLHLLLVSSWACGSVSWAILSAYYATAAATRQTL